MDGFEKNFNILKKSVAKNVCEQFLMDTLANISQNIFAYSFVSEHSKHFLAR